MQQGGNEREKGEGRDMGGKTYQAVENCSFARANYLIKIIALSPACFKKLVHPVRAATYCAKRTFRGFARPNRKFQEKLPDNHVKGTSPSITERYNTGILTTRVPLFRGGVDRPTYTEATRIGWCTINGL